MKRQKAVVTQRKAYNGVVSTYDALYAKIYKFLETQGQAVSNIIPKAKMAGLAALVAANMAGPGLAPKAKAIGAGAAVTAGMLSKGCVKEQEPEIEEPQLSVEYLEQMIVDYVIMCCIEHGDMHYRSARQMDPAGGVDVSTMVRALHHLCIMHFANSTKGDTISMDAIGEMRQNPEGKVIDGRLTNLRLTGLEPGEKLSPQGMSISETDRVGDGFTSYFYMKDEIIRE